MESKLSQDAGEIYAYAQSLINTKIELAKITGAEKVSAIISNLILALGISIMCILLSIAMLIAIAYAIAVYTESIAIGLVAVIAILGIATLVLWLGKDRWLRLPIQNFILNYINALI